MIEGIMRDVEQGVMQLVEPHVILLVLHYVQEEHVEALALVYVQETVQEHVQVVAQD